MPTLRMGLGDPPFIFVDSELPASSRIGSLRSLLVPHIDFSVRKMNTDDLIITGSQTTPSV